MAMNSQDAFHRLGLQARAARSNVLIVMRDGIIDELVSFGVDHDPILIMSVTKFVVGIGLGSILARAGVSIDQPVADLFPEWRQGRKRHITIRMLMNHTSGLQNDPNAGVELEAAPDWVQLALCAELAHDPGSVFAYNNKAVALLAGVVERVVGSPLDEALARSLFAPLGITKVRWATDSRGTPYAPGGLWISPHDLARIGHLVLDGGVHGSKQVIPPGWIATISAPGQALRSDFGLLCRRWIQPTTTRLLGIYHDGWLGQYLVICPDARLVAVRLLDRERGLGDDDTEFADFLEYLEPVAASPRDTTQ